jgi:hypothetical protein
MFSSLTKQRQRYKNEKVAISDSLFGKNHDLDFNAVEHFKLIVTRRQENEYLYEQKTVESGAYSSKKQ